MHYTSVLFDLDGTLLDTLGDLTAAMNRTLTRHGLPERTRQQMRTALGNGARRLMELSVPSGTDSALFETLLAEYNADYAAHCRIETAPYPGVAALLRTLLTEREVLLLDEPFGALDALTRLQLQLGLTDVWQTFHKTILLVTHDVEEAIFLSDQILVLSPRPGRVRRQLTVPLPRPRTVDMLASPEVMGMKKELLELLLQEEGTGHESNG